MGRRIQVGAQLRELHLLGVERRLIQEDTVEEYTVDDGAVDDGSAGARTSDGRPVPHGALRLRPAHVQHGDHARM